MLYFILIISLCSSSCALGMETSTQNTPTATSTQLVESLLHELPPIQLTMNDFERIGSMNESSRYTEQELTIFDKKVTEHASYKIIKTHPAAYDHAINELITKTNLNKEAKEQMRGRLWHNPCLQCLLTSFFTIRTCRKLQNGKDYTFECALAALTARKACLAFSSCRARSRGISKTIQLIDRATIHFKELQRLQAQGLDPEQISKKIA